ncbi:MAG: ROK family protein, partial [Acidimicrobiales bacterium]
MDLALAVDIGGTKFGVGLVTRSGELLDREMHRVDSRDTADEHFEELARLVHSQVGRARERHGMPVTVCGVGSAGPIAPNAEEVSPLNIPAWRDFPLRSRLAALTGLPVYGDGDAKALALAEGWLGAAREVDNFIAMVVSTGVGGGIVLNGELLEGASGNAGHVGHVVVEPNGRRCACGGRG